MRPTFFLTLFSIGVGSLGCHGSSTTTASTNAPPPPTLTYNPYGPPPPTYGTQPPPPATGPATAPPPTATGTLPPPPAGTAAQPIDSSAAQAAATQLALLGTSMLPPGMQPEGAPFAANFGQGQTLEQPLSLQVGKCYSIAAAGVGITQIHIDLIGVPLAVTLMMSKDTGPTAVIGGAADDCWKYPFPIPGTARIVVRAVQGSGIAAMQVYVK